MFGVFTADDGPDLHVQTPDTAQGVGHPLLFIPQLCVIGHMPPGAAAAASENRTIALRLHTVAGRRNQFLDTAIGQVFFNLQNPALNAVSHRGEGDDHGQSAALSVQFRAADAASFGRCAGYI